MKHLWAGILVGTYTLLIFAPFTMGVNAHHIYNELRAGWESVQ
jgi:hypothetical protein